jgi:prepilin-type processing-associated H-X9-DG protein
VILFDGFGWNETWQAYRITGQRHGRPDRSRPYDTGTTNLLFLDWHAEAAARSDLPTDGLQGSHFTNGATFTEMQFDAGRQYMRSPKYIWSLSQDY